MNYKKTRGAVSVFLVLILVPCIVVTSVFVDLGRAHMSKSMAESSADLALNTLMTNYDADLNEYYGMIASCQTISEFYDLSAEFFLRTISSQGMSEDEIYLLSDYYSYVTNDDSIFDFLQTEAIEDVKVGAVNNANLSNAALVKTQIVEFMKYRAPIEITKGIISRFKDANGNTTSAFSDLVESSANEQLVENKQAYYEAEGELLTAAFYSYVAIFDYYSSARAQNLNNAKLNEYVETINGYKTVYAQIHEQYVKNLCNTTSLSRYYRPAYSLDKYTSTYTYQSSSVYSKKEKEDGVDVYYITEEHYHDLMDDLKQEISDFKNALNALSEAGSDLMNNMYGTEDSQPYAVQWWQRMNAAINAPSGTNYSTKVKNAAEDLLKAYAKVKAAGDCELIPEENPSTKPYDQMTEKERDHARSVSERSSDLINQTKTLQSRYLTSGRTDNSDSYLKTVTALENVSANYSSQISADTVKVTMNGQQVSVNSALFTIASDLKNTKLYLEGMVEELDLAIDGKLIGKPKSLDKLKELAKTYNSTFTAWSNEADDQDTTMKIDDYTAIQGGYTGDDSKLNVDRAAKEINEQSVTELKTRLVNIRSQLKSLITSIEAIQYGNTKIYSILNIGNFRSSASSKVSASSIPLTNGELKTYASTTFAQLFKPTGDVIVTLDHTNDNAYNPDISPEEGEKDAVDTPELFVYFHKQWDGADVEQFEKAKKEEDDAKGEADTIVSDAQEAAADCSVDRVDIVPEFSNGNGFKAGTALITSFADLIKNLVEGRVDAIRDDIYVTAYMMEMFSYATYEKEGRYHLLTDEVQKKLTPSNTDQHYSTKDTEWASTDLEDTYNKSLTNKLINNSNNAAYLAEIEYILYGQSSCKENVKKAMGTIYTIRLLLNTGSAFQNFWGTSNDTGIAINSAAGLISSAFCGVIPPAVIKVVLLPILAAVESALDLRRLSAGLPVEIYKKAEDWWFALPSGLNSYGAVMNILKGEPIKTNSGQGLFYSDYLMLFVYLGLSTGGSVEEDMLLRAAEAIQTNLRQHDGIDQGYSMKNAQVYFEISTKLRVKPLMITLPFFQLDAYDNNMETKTDWCTYSIKTTRGYS